MKILVIDDEPGLRQTVSRILGAEGHSVGTASEGEEALGKLSSEDVDLVLCDLRMPKMDGLEFIERYTSGGGHALVIAMSAYGDSDTAIAAMQKGAYDYVQKPFRAEEVVLAVRKAAEREKLRAKVEELEGQLSTIRSADDIIGHSPTIRAALDMARKVARHPSTVLITGESGTGKELIARLVHTSSPRADKAFVAVNCGAIPEPLLESELFGHVKGAFTSADRDKIGLFEEANGGTLFLDEIGTMAAAVQAKLLRALEAGEVRRIGENDPRRVDVRFVAATNSDLQSAVDAGTFRNDLFYRLNVHRIHLPPLRERPGDIEELVDFFLHRVGPPAGVTSVSAPARVALLGYDYPGNVRQLEHVIQRAVAVARGPVVEPSDLPEELFAARAADPQSAAADGTVAAARERAEREMIVATLARNHGEVSATARELQVSRTTLWRLMKKHQI